MQLVSSAVGNGRRHSSDTRGVAHRLLHSLKPADAYGIYTNFHKGAPAMMAVSKIKSAKSAQKLQRSPRRQSCESIRRSARKKRVIDSVVIDSTSDQPASFAKVAADLSWRLALPILGAAL
jgi:hypothetical protein